jgi:hypothetical protein
LIRISIFEFRIFSIQLARPGGEKNFFPASSLRSARIFINLAGHLAAPTTMFGQAEMLDPFYSLSGALTDFPSARSY